MIKDMAIKGNEALEKQASMLVDSEGNALSHVTVNDFNGTLSMADAVAVAPQLLSLEMVAYQTKYPSIKYRDVFNVDTSDHEGSETLAYKVYDAQGMAEFLSSDADDYPFVQVSAKKESTDVKSLGIAVKYSLAELRASAMAGGQSIDATKIRVANEAVERKIDSVAFVGDTTHNMVGLSNHPNITKTTSGANWDAATPNQKIGDTIDCINAVSIASNETHMPNKLIMTNRMKTILATTFRSDASDLTCLQSVLMNNEFITDKSQIYTTTRFKGIGATSKDLMVAGQFDQETAVVKIPMPFKWYPQEQRMGKIEMGGETRVGGLVVRYPLAFNITTGC